MVNMEYIKTKIAESLETLYIIDTIFIRENVSSRKFNLKQNKNTLVNKMTNKAYMLI